jgi:hypothetical protein
VQECFNIANAFSCGKLSQLIYWPEETIIETAKDWKIAEVAVIGYVLHILLEVL